MRWWRRHAGVRVRSTIAAASIVAGALLIAALTGWVLARRTLTNEALDVVSARGQVVQALVRQQGSAGVARAGRLDFGEVIQVLDADGKVLAAAPASAADLALARALPPLPADDRQVFAEVPALPLSQADEPYVLVARRVHDRGSGQDLVVVVGRSVAGLAETLGVVGKLGVVGLPLLVVVTGVVTYVFTGRALRPVEHLRGQVQSITSRQLGERLPVPAVRDEIGRLAETMNAMLTSLQGASEAQRRFVADAGHELRNPLATILTALEVARAESDPSSPTRRLVDDVAPEAARMGRLVDDLLLLARADERGLPLRSGDVDLDDVIEAEARRLRAMHTTIVSVRTEPVRVTGDRDRLIQVVRNVTDNAQRYARSRVHLNVHRDGEKAVILVQDDGPGISPQDRTRVFDRFVRLDASRHRGGGGSGLGLAIVREIVLGHRGQVTILAGPDGGAVVRVVLPLPPTVLDREPEGEGRGQDRMPPAAAGRVSRRPGPADNPSPAP